MAHRYAPDFEAWWKAWPSWRRVEKKEAAEEWEKARKADELPPLDYAIQQARRYAAEMLRLHLLNPKDLKRYTIYPARYIKRRRWEDELPPVGSQQERALSPEDEAARAALIEEVKREAEAERDRRREVSRRVRELRGQS